MLTQRNDVFTLNLLENGTNISQNAGRYFIHVTMGFRKHGSRLNIFISNKVELLTMK